MEVGGYYERMTEGPEMQPSDAGPASGDDGGSVARLLLAARTAKEISRSELARAAGCSRQYVEMLESGDRVRPSPQLVAAFAAALELHGEQREQFFAAGGVVPPKAAPDDRFDTLALAVALAAALPHPAFVIDACWSLMRWNAAVPYLFELYLPALPAGAMNLLEIVFAPEGHDRFLNWEEVAARLAGCLKRDSRGHTHTAIYRESLAALRRLPGFATMYKTAKPTATATATSPVGLRHGRLGPLWFVEALVALPGANSPRVLIYLPAEPATAAALKHSPWSGG